MTALVGLSHPRPSGGSVSSGLGAQHALSGDQRLQTLELLVGGAKCASCLGRIESAVLRLPGMETARLNLTTGKLHVAWRGALAARAVVEAVIGLGYSAAPYDVDKRETDAAREERGLVIAMVVAGLATVGVMFLSEPVWFGEDMDASAIALLRWLAALIAVPASLFSGQSFFASALASIRGRRMNKDVPISIVAKDKKGLRLKVSDLLRPARAVPDLDLLFAPVKRQLRSAQSVIRAALKRAPEKSHSSKAQSVHSHSDRSAPTKRHRTKRPPCQATPARS